MPNNRKGVCCDLCMKRHCQGRTYKCLVCYDLDLCAECYDSKKATGFHSGEHPCQCVLTTDLCALYYGGEGTVDRSQSFTCPLCGEMGFTNKTLQLHITERHNDVGYENVELNTTHGLWMSSIPRLFVCPICAVTQSRIATQMHHDLRRHLSMEHPVRGSTESALDSEYTTDSLSTQSDSSESETNDSTTENDENVPPVYSRDDADLLLPERALQRLNILNPDPNYIFDIYHFSRSRSRIRRASRNARRVSQRPHSVTRRLREAARTLQDRLHDRVIERQKEIQQRQREVTRIQLERLERRYASPAPEDRCLLPTPPDSLILPSPPDDHPSSSKSAIDLILMHKTKNFHIKKSNFLLHCDAHENEQSDEETALWKKQQAFLHTILLSAALHPKRVELHELHPSVKHYQRMQIKTGDAPI